MENHTSENESSSKFCRNAGCEYFPCHKTEDDASFNCLFCYCPLYALGADCGGNFSYNEAGVKDCSACLLPHTPGGYDYIMSRWPDVSAMAKKKQAPKKKPAEPLGAPAEPAKSGEGRSIHDKLLTARNLICLVAAVLFCLSFLSFLLFERDIGHTLRAWAYLAGALAYFTEILAENSLFHVRRTAHEMLMPYLFCILYVFMSLDYFVE